MQDYIELRKKNILIAVAHPDDETLWFFQFIQELKRENNVQIFCVTHDAKSPRGGELRAVAAKCGFSVMFGNCADPGLNKLLNTTELLVAMNQIISGELRYDLIITHPLHGGEKPHPHHIQVHMAAIQVSRTLGIDFGFFSERQFAKLTCPSKFSFRLRDKVFILWRLFRGYRLLRFEKGSLTFLLGAIANLTQMRGSYNAYETKVNKFDKQTALKMFASQEQVLMSYSTFRNSEEYFFIRKAKPLSFTYDVNVEKSSSSFSPIQRAPSE